MSKLIDIQLLLFYLGPLRPNSDHYENYLPNLIQYSDLLLNVCQLIYIVHGGKTSFLDIGLVGRFFTLQIGRIVFVRL